MKNHNIFNILYFVTFFLANLQTFVLAKFKEKKEEKNRVRNYTREKVEKSEMLTIYIS